MSHHHHGAAAPGQAAPQRTSFPTRLTPPGHGDALPAGLSPPQKDDCPELAGCGAIKEQEKSDIANCASPTAKCKRFATLRARLKLSGWTLNSDAAGEFTASRWGKVRELDGLAAVDAFATQVGAPS